MAGRIAALPTVVPRRASEGGRLLELSMSAHVGYAVFSGESVNERYADL
jgi:hypothetical protein